MFTDSEDEDVDIFGGLYSSYHIQLFGGSSEQYLAHYKHSITAGNVYTGPKFLRELLALGSQVEPVCFTGFRLLSLGLN